MRIKKVKVNSDDKITMIYEQSSKTGSWDEYQFTCSDKARPAFYSKLQALAVYVVEMCELPNDYVCKINVRGVSVGYGGSNEVMGATITAQMALENSNCNLNLNTPYKASDSYSDAPADPKQLLPDKCIDILNELYEECKAYIGGEREQGKLFDVA
jgi:hypothetical protein